MLFPVPSDLYFVLLRFLEYLSVITVAWHGSGYNSIFEFGSDAAVTNIRHEQDYILTHRNF